MGFSQRTCFPALRADTVISQCETLGVLTYTSSSESYCSSSVYCTWTRAPDSPKSAAALVARSFAMSQKATRSTRFFNFMSAGKCLSLAIAPHPMNPNFSFLAMEVSPRRTTAVRVSRLRTRSPLLELRHDCGIFSFELVSPQHEEGSHIQAQWYVEK